MADPDKESTTYIASAWLGWLIMDLKERGVLSGKVKESVTDAISEFKNGPHGGDPNSWHTDLFDAYREIFGFDPEASP